MFRWRFIKSLLDGRGSEEFNTGEGGIGSGLVARVAVFFSMALKRQRDGVHLAERNVARFFVAEMWRETLCIDSRMVTGCFS